MAHKVSQDKLYTNGLTVTQNYYKYYCATLANSSDIPQKKILKTVNHPNLVIRYETLVHVSRLLEINKAFGLDSTTGHLG